MPSEKPPDKVSWEETFKTLTKSGPLEEADSVLWDEWSSNAPPTMGSNWRDTVAMDKTEERWEAMALSATKAERTPRHMVGTYKFRKRAILTEALVADGKAHHVKESGWDVSPDGNWRLALLGRTVLGLVMADAWYKSGESRVLFDQWYTRTMASVPYLVKIAQTKRIERLMRPELAKGAEWSNNAKAATVQALIGAVYEDSDGNMAQVKAFIEELGLKKPQTVVELAEVVGALAEARADIEEAAKTKG